ncbi:MAG: MFS transporter [Bacteriovoracaceae bacterium]|nr:MFS transporter [Bacteriovoracaceae bacterium]
MNFPYALRAFRAKNFRLYYLGQGISLIGSWMQEVALAWLILRLTNDRYLMGLLVFYVNVPVFIASPLAGVWADRFSKKNLLLILSYTAAFLALLMTWLAYLPHPSVPLIFLLATIMGAVAAMDMPVRLAFLREILEKPEDVGNAIALNSSLIHATRLIGPALAGFLIAEFDEGGCFLINALSYIAVIWALYLMKPKSRPNLQDATQEIIIDSTAALPAAKVAPHLPSTPSANPLPNKNSSLIRVLQELYQGLIYALKNKVAFAALGSVALICLFGMFHTVVLPIYARDGLHGQADTFGVLMSIMGFGSLIGALLLLWARIEHLAQTLLLFSAFVGPCYFMLAWANQMVAAAPLLFLAGMGFTYALGACNTFLQTFTHARVRGKVMAWYTLAFKGSVPFCALLAGQLTKYLSLSQIFITFGLLSCLATVWIFIQQKNLRRATRHTATAKA